MFRSSIARKRLQAGSIARSIPSFGLENLEGRQLLCGFGFGGGGFGGFGPHGGGGPGPLGNTIQFSLTPTAVQTELDTLSGQELAPTQPVTLKNVNGIEEYIVTLNGTGTVTQYTVDQNGNPVTAPTQSTTTWAVLSGTGTDSNAAATAEITAIATALGLTAPTATTTVNVTTTSGGATTYSVNLSPSASTGTAGWWHGWMDRGTTISVDALGNPVGNQNLPFSVIPAAIQAGLNAGAPAGATALDPTSTQNVSVQTLDGVTLYSVRFAATGTTTTVTVDATGKLSSLRTHSTTTFGALTSPILPAVQSELQALATAAGVTTAIDPTQTVNVLTEANGTTLYSVTLSTTVTDSQGHTHTRFVTVTVDANGNATTLPNQGGGESFGGRHEGHGGGFGFGGGGDGDDDSGTTGSTTTDTTTTTSGKVASAKSTAKVKASAKLVSKVVSKVVSKLVHKK